MKKITFVLAGLLLITWGCSSEEAKEAAQKTREAIDATKIAVDNGLGTTTNPIVNTAILGAFSKAVGNISLSSITEAIAENAPIKPLENQKAAQEAFEQTK